MFAIVTKYIAEHKLSKDMSNEELSHHALALLELLTDKLKRDKSRQRFQKGYNFSKEQVFILVPDQRICRIISQVTFSSGQTEESGAREVNICQVSNLIPRKTVKMIAQRIMRDNLGKKEVKAITKALTSHS